MATSEQGGGGGEATMFSDLVGLKKEDTKGGGDDRVEEPPQGVDVSKVVREVVKESLVPLIQRVMLKIDALDGKVKQMQLVLEEMEEDGRERDVWLKKGLDEMKEELVSVRAAVGERKEEQEEEGGGGNNEEEDEESESESEVGGLDIEELQALLNQKLAMESKKKKNNKKKGDGENTLLYGDGGYRQQQSGVAMPSSASTVYGAAPPGPPPAHHHQHHVAPGSSSSSGGPPPPPHPPAGRGPPPPPGPHPVSSSSYAAPGGQPHGQGLRVPPPPVTHDGMHSHSTLYTGQPSATTSGSYAPAYTTAYQPAPPTGPPPPAQQHQHPSSSTGSVPIEKVIDDIAIMGFSREEVRNVLRELTAQGKSVDMNIVLDRLGAR
ncbi:hypothetical protein PSENEW3_00003563 [Picochlorum sp. SENEW3]|nr:hypothetical protein PSENEW3_00003563 [Picochlorum sp. SENEW3]